jgi:hypothetical protein
MLTKILSVTGRPGLFKLISTNKNMNVVESLTDGKRIAVYMHEKIVALNDVSVYTEDGDTPLRDVLKSIKEKENGNKIALSSKASAKEFFKYLEEVLPNYNKDSVYPSDVKKIISWYNLLIENNIDLESEETTKEVSEETTEEASKEKAEDVSAEN